MDLDRVNNNYDRQYQKFNDIERDEEPWGVPQEELIVSWRASCESLAKSHETSARACKRKNICFALPAMMIPMMMTPLSAAFKESEWVTYVEMSGFMLTAIASATVQFFSFAAKSERHYAYANRYADLVTDIDQELSKPRQYRQQVDTFSLKVKMTYDSLNRNAPDL